MKLDVAAVFGSMHGRLLTAVLLAALVVAGVLSVVLFPIVASALLDQRAGSRAARYSDHDRI